MSAAPKLADSVAIRRPMVREALARRRRYSKKITITLH